jgi:uncharacterized membrane protein (UPF0136 family)
MDPNTGLHSAAVVSVLATSGGTSGSLLAASFIGLVSAVVSAQRCRTQRMFQPATTD